MKKLVYSTDFQCNDLNKDVHFKIRKKEYILNSLVKIIGERFVGKIIQILSHSKFLDIV